MTDNHVSAVVLGSVMLCWFVFAAAFLFRKWPPKAKEQKREKSFVVGILLQGLGYALVWTFQRPTFTPIFPMSFIVEMFLGVLTIAIAVSSTWLVVASVRILGKQWSVAARLVEGHALVTEGPYNIVRHPIYTGMFGMMVATGLAISFWQALAVALVAFWMGTMLRSRSEETLLRNQFGKEFEEYAVRIPALFPKLF